jgi:methyl coenzyme M reductase alpha subunit
MQLKHLHAVKVTPEQIEALETLFDNESLSYDIDSGSDFVFYDKENDEFYGTNEQPSCIPYDEFVSRVEGTYEPQQTWWILEEYEEYKSIIEARTDLTTTQKAELIATSDSLITAIKNGL